jgi:hypothetical protein
METSRIGLPKNTSTCKMPRSDLAGAGPFSWARICANTRRTATTQNPQRTLRVVEATGLEHTVDAPPFSPPARPPLTIYAETVGRSCRMPRTTRCTPGHHASARIAAATATTTARRRIRRPRCEIGDVVNVREDRENISLSNPLVPISAPSPAL